MKCMTCRFYKRRLREYPCNSCKEVRADVDRSYYVERKEVAKNDKRTFADGTERD